MCWSSSLVPMKRCVMNYNVLIVRVRSYVDLFVVPVMSDFVFSADLSLHPRNIAPSAMR